MAGPVLSNAGQPLVAQAGRPWPEPRPHQLALAEQAAFETKEAATEAASIREVMLARATPAMKATH